jgi:H+/Cl- antiporter ClcA
MASAAGALSGALNAYLALVCILFVAKADSYSQFQFSETFDWRLIAVSSIAGVLVSSTLWMIARPDRA